MSKREMRKIKKDDLLSIKEFSELTGLSTATLRHYDELNILKPAKRGGNGNESYRHYSPVQFTDAKMVKVLREIDVPLEEIAEFAAARSPDALIKLLNKYGKRIVNEIHFLKTLDSIINTYNKNVFEGMCANENEISVVEMVELPIMLGGKTEFEDGDEFYNAFLNFCFELRSPRLNPSYPIGGYFEDFDSFLEHSSEPDRFFSLDPNGNERREKGLYLVGYTRGYYGETGDLPARMAAYASRHKIVFEGPVYNLYLYDELSIPDSNNYLLQVAASVKASDVKVARHPNLYVQDE